MAEATRWPTSAKIAVLGFDISEPGRGSRFLVELPLTGDGLSETDAAAGPGDPGARKGPPSTSPMTP